MKIIGIIGTRRRHSSEDLNLVRRVFKSLYEPGDMIVSGGCAKGGDYFAEVIAKEEGISILIHYPDWKRHGRGAGFVRNTKIANDSHFLIACVHPDRKGGTEHTIKEFLKHKTKNNLILT